MHVSLVKRGRDARSVFIQQEKGGKHDSIVVVVVVIILFSVDVAFAMSDSFS